jgi:hypothetical protein
MIPNSAIKFNKFLIDIGACSQATTWARWKTFDEVYETCHRGDWLLWLFIKTADKNETNARLLTKTKGHCTNTARELLTDQWALDAIDTAIAFGNYECDQHTIDKISDEAATGVMFTGRKLVTTQYVSITERRNMCVKFAAAYAAQARKDDYTLPSGIFISSVYDIDDAVHCASTHISNDNVAHLKITADIVRENLPKSVWNVMK